MIGLYKVSSQGRGIGASDSFMYYAFHVPEWQKTKEIGLSIDNTIAESFLLNSQQCITLCFR